MDGRGVCFCEPRGASPNFARDHLSATWDDPGISSGCRDVDCIWTCTQLIGENGQGCAADALSYLRWAEGVVVMLWSGGKRSSIVKDDNAWMDLVALIMGDWC